MKCAYKFCKFNKEVKENEGVRYKNRWHHKECAEERKNKDSIRELFINKIDPKTNKAMLNKAIKQLINDKGYDSKLVLFSLNFAIQNNIKLNSPFGMHYLVANDKILKSYEEKILFKEQNKIVNKILQNKESGEETKFTYNPSKKNKNWNKVLPD